LGLSDRGTILFAGQLVPRKRPDLLIPALAGACTAGIDAQLVLAGPEDDPVYCAQMRQASERLGVSDRVVWYGFTEKMSDLMRAADVLALPSLNEGLPGVIMEAMACGLPCIYTNISGARDLIDDGKDGRIISADGSGLREAIIDYLGDLSLVDQHGQKARSKAEARFGSRAVFQRYLKVFENVHAHRPPAA
jgi:glycosyltransferase involved in cell wall biosynthesis